MRYITVKAENYENMQCHQLLTFVCNKGIQKMATGHLGYIKTTNGRFYLSKSKDQA